MEYIEGKDGETVQVCVCMCNYVRAFVCARNYVRSHRLQGSVPVCELCIWL